MGAHQDGGSGPPTPAQDRPVCASIRPVQARTQPAPTPVQARTQPAPTPSAAAPAPTPVQARTQPAPTPAPTHLRPAPAAHRGEPSAPVAATPRDSSPVTPWDSPVTPWDRCSHPGQGATLVHDGGDRLDTVALWLPAPRTAHPGDQVGWPRGGLAPSATYSVRMATGGYLVVVAGRFEAWLAEPGDGPALTTVGELVPPWQRGAGPNVIPLLRPRAVPPPRTSGEPNCPCRGHAAALHVADQQHEHREQNRLRRLQAQDDAVTAAQRLLAAAVRPDGGPDVGHLTTGLRVLLADSKAVGHLAQHVVTALPAATVAAIMRRLAEPALTAVASVEVAFRVFAQRALAVHGLEVLEAIPARLVADGMAAEALVRPRLERLLGQPLPGDLGQMARWSLHGLPCPFGDVDPADLRVALQAIGALI